MQSISQEVMRGLENGMLKEGNESIMGVGGRERPEGSGLVESWGGGALARCLDCLLEEGPRWGWGFVGHMGGRNSCNSCRR